VGFTGVGNGQFAFPYGIAVNPNTDYVYVADYHNNRIEKFYSNGTLIEKWGALGTSTGHFEYPNGVAVNPKTDNVYVADSGNHRIQEFTADGTFIRMWGKMVVHY
jgi:DNA-binding beta-propeller fold protein YncE